MIRAVVYLLVTVLVVTLLRAVMAVLQRGVASLFQPDAGQRRAAPRSAGQLRRDPVCGAYVSEDLAVKKSAGTKTFFFCSPACRDRHHDA
jgi:YHS domain-containing protein